MTHWTTYFPGTTAFAKAQQDGTLKPEQVQRILSGTGNESFEVARLVDHGETAARLREIERVAVLFELMGLVPPRRRSSSCWRAAPTAGCRGSGR